MKFRSAFEIYDKNWVFGEKKDFPHSVEQVKVHKTLGQAHARALKKGVKEMNREDKLRWKIPNIREVK